MRKRIAHKNPGDPSLNPHLEKQIISHRQQIIFFSTDYRLWISTNNLNINSIAITFYCLFFSSFTSSAVFNNLKRHGTNKQRFIEIINLSRVLNKCLHLSKHRVMTISVVQMRLENFLFVCFSPQLFYYLPILSISENKRLFLWSTALTS